MEKIEFMDWLLEVDVDKTKEFYNKEFELCDCLYCENYRKACKYLSLSVKELFAMLGIHPSKPSHLSEFGEMADGMRIYGGCYHLVGKIVEGEYCTSSTWNDANTAEIGNFTIGFEKDLMFVHDDFPHPVLQIGFEAKMPWVLDGETGE